MLPSEGVVNSGEYSQGVREGTGVPMQSAVPSRIANYAAIEIRTKLHQGGGGVIGGPPLGKCLKNYIFFAVFGLVFIICKEIKQHINTG